MRIPFSGPNWAVSPLNLWLCYRRNLLWIYPNQRRHLQRAGTRLHSEQNSYANTLKHMEYTHIHRFAYKYTQRCKCAHTHTHTHIGSTYLRSLTLADCQPLQTETRQHHRTPHPHDRRLRGTPQITVAPPRQLLTFQSPLSSSPTAQAPASGNMFQNRAGLCSHTYTHTPPQC